MTMLGKYRKEAVWRAIVGSIWFVIATTLVVVVWLPVALAVGTIDVILQLLFNRESIAGGMNRLTEPFAWWASNFRWWLLGSGEFDALPYR